MGIGLLDHTTGDQVGFTQPIFNDYIPWNYLEENIAQTGTTYIEFFLVGTPNADVQLDLAGTAIENTVCNLYAQGITGGMPYDEGVAQSAGPLQMKTTTW